MCASSFDSALGGFLFVSDSVSIVNREGIEGLRISMPVLGLHYGVRSHLPQIDVAFGAPQGPRGELLHNVPTFYVVQSEQVSMQKNMLFLGNANRETHGRDR